MTPTHPNRRTIRDHQPRQLSAWLFASLLLLAPLPGHAQSFMLRYVNTTSGAMTFCGNTLGLAKLTGVNEPGQLDSIGAFITLNTNSQVGTYPPGTTLNWTNNSSAAVLQLPANSTVLYAELVWAGSAQITTDQTHAGNVLSNLNTQVNFIQPNGITNLITPDPTTASLVTNGTDAIFYVRSANVTALVQATGAGTYAAGGIPSTVLATEDANNACGWTLAVVYGNPSLVQRNLSLFIGDSFAISGGTAPAPVSVSGFCAPPTGTVNARLYVSAVEGDPNKTGDQMKFGATTGTLAALAGPNNLVNNFFASQINDDNGVLNTNGTFGLSNSVPPNVGFSCRQGWDITSVDVSGIISNGLTSAYAQNVTSGDGYSVNVLGLQINVGAPVLTTTQSVDKASTFVGDTLTYTVVVTNSGTADAVNLIFTDPLPFGTSFVTNTFTTNGVTVAGANPVNGVPIPIIKQNGSITFTYQVTVDQIPPSAEFITAATISFQYSGACAQSPIINATLVNANVQTLVPLLTVSKQASLTNVIPGANLTYTIDVPNVGTTNTTGSTLLDPIPAGVAYVTNTTTLNGTNIPDINGTNMPFTVAREINGPGRPAGVIDVGDTAVVTFEVKISATPPARLNNSATVYANGIDPTTAQNAAANITPVYSDLAVGLAGSPNPVAAGGAISYTINVTNNGPDSLNIITNFITLYLPISSAVLSPVYTPATGSYNPLTGVWSGITLASNGVVTMTVSGTVSSGVATSNIISSVTVSPPPGVLDIVTNNNSASATNAISKIADLAVTLTDGLTNVLPGNVINYTVTVINLGPSTLDSLSLSNSFSSYLTNLSMLPNQGSYNSVNGIWSGLDLAAGNSITLSVQATVRTNVTGAFTNVSTVTVPTGVTDPVLTNNTATDVDVAYASPVADLAIGKTAAASVLAGTSLTYTISITNLGPFAASSVLATDSLPAGVTFVSASGGGTTNAGVVTWSLGNLTFGASSNVTLIVTAPASGSITNIATTGSPTSDPNLTNNATPPVVTAVLPAADVAIGKSAAASVLAVSNLVYTISVTNLGPVTASSVLVTDALPANVIFVSASSGGTTNAGVATWNLGNLANGTVSNLTLTVTAPASGFITNLASAGSSVTDPNLTNNVSLPVVTAVTPLANLAIAKAGSANVLAASNLVYTISVTNFGPSTASSVLVTDTLPAGVTFVSASGGGTTNAGAALWSLGNLANGAISNVTLTVIAPASGPITNIASVGSPTGDTNTLNNVSPAVITTVTPLADLTIAKTGPASVLASGSLSYAISVTNLGPSIASTVVVTDTLPAGVIFVSASGGGTTNAGVAKWSLGNLANGAVSNVTLTVIAPVSGSITNVASVSSPTGDTNLLNNVTAPVLTTITPAADLGIGKSAPTSVLAASNLVYTISVTNLGPSTASSVLVTDTLPVNVVFVSATGGGTTNAGLAKWSFGNLANGAISNVTLTVTAPASGSITNIASTGSSTADPNSTNNVTPPVITTVTPLANLTIAKTGPASVLAASNINYTISVTNLGPSSASSVVVTDTLPTSVTFVSASGGGTTNAGFAIWSLGTLTAGQVSNVTVMVTAPASGTLTNLANVASPTGDTNLLNNVTAPVITTVTPVADVAIAKIGPANVLAASNFVYTISVTNFGPSTASTVLVTDTLPANVVFVSASGGGTTNAGLAKWSFGNMLNGAVSNVTLTVTAPVSGSITNIASAGSPTGDPNSTNNVTPPVVTAVTLLADLAIAKTGPASVLAVSNLVYTISVTNLGPSTASSVLVTDTLPAGVTFVSASGGGATNAGAAKWSLGTMLNGAVSNLTLTVTAPASGTITNIASIGSPTADPNSTNNVTLPVITTVTPLADLIIAKTGPATVFAASNLSYTISVTNLGPSSAGTVVVTDTLPATVIFVSASGGGTTNAGVAKWSLGTLIAGQVSNVTVTVTAPASGTLTNLANVASPTGDTNLLNNVTAPVITTVTAVADVGIGKSAAASVLAVSNLVYTISVTNFGPSTASTVLVTDTLPANVVFVSASGGGTTNAGLAKWNLGNMLNGAVTNVTLTVTAPASGSITNFASAGSPTGDPNSTNNATPPVVTTVTPLADLTIAKTGPASVLATSNINYTISVTNLGPSSASSVVVTDALPATVIFVSASGGGTTNAGFAMWSLGMLTAGQVSNVTVTVTAPASGTLTNLANVASPTGDTNILNNVTAPVITTVTPVADVAIGKSAMTSVLAASNLVYTISVTNFGPSTASTVLVTDTLPANVVFVSASGGGTTNAGVAMWSLGNILNGAISNVTLTVIAPASGSITNTASAGSPTSDPNPTNNVTPPVVTAVTPLADLTITKTGPANVLAASNVNYTISVTNLGPSSASSVVVTDTLPASVVFLSASGGGTTNAGFAMWSLGTMTAGQVSNVTVTVTAPASGTLTNFANVASPTGDTNILNNVTAPVITTVTPVADVAIGKSAAASVLAVSNLVYIISVTNFGPSTASSVLVTDTLPAGVTFVSASGGGTTNAGIATWSLGNMLNGAISNVTLTVIAPASGSITNVASGGSPTSDPNSTNNVTPPVVTTVTPLADLTIVKTGPANVFAASNLSYTISVTNLGPSSASSVVVTDTLPAGVIFTSASGGGGTNNSGAVTWALGTLTAGQARNLTVLVTAPATGTLTNIANVASPTGDTNLLNNTAPPVVTTVAAVADLAIGKSAPATVLAASNLVYTISVTNFGPSTASGILVTDSLPLGVSFVSASGSGATNAGIVTWNLGSLANGEISNVTLTVVAPASGSITNIATVGSPAGDPNLTNNSSSPVITTIIPLADLTIAKTGPGNVAAAGSLNYTINVTNLGPSSASSVVVTDTLPAGVIFTSASGGGGTNNSGAVIWALGTLTAGQASNVTVMVTAPASGTLTNIANVTSPTGDTNLLNNTTPPVVTTVTPMADVSVVKTGPAGILFGTNFNYTITVSNAGPSIATSVTVTDSLPAGLVFLSATPTTTTNASSQVIWNLGDFAAGTGSNLTVTVISTQRGSLTNLASGGSPTLDPVPTNNVAPPVVTAVTNNPPIANPDSYAIAENTTNTLTPLVNDVVQTPGGNLTIIAVSSTNGIVSILNTTNVTFTPTNNFLGTTTLMYTISDNVGGTNSSYINVLVTNVPPVANPYSYAIAENTTNSFAVLVNDYVVTPGGSLALISVSTTNGMAATNGANVSFTPASNYLGTLTLLYTISDNVGGMASSYITVLVTNAPPVANPDSYAIAENTTNTFTPLVNDVLKTPGGNLTVVAVTSTNGIVSILNTTNVTFTPTNNFLGTATLTYTISDSVGGTNSSYITVLVTNVPPVANPDSYAIAENTTNTLTPLVNDVLKTPGGDLTIIAVSSTNGLVSILNSTNITFTPTNNFLGATTLLYTITDNVGGTNSSYITVLVTNVPPVANPDSYAVAENTTNTLTPLVNDVLKTPGGDLTIIAVSSTNGLVSILNNTNVTFTPTNNFLGTTTLIYTITDNVGGTNTSYINVLVTNVPPVANPDSYAIAENTTNTFTPLVNDVLKTPGGDLTIVAVSSTNGLVSILNSTNVTFTPTNNFLGTTTLTYTISDNVGGTNSSYITVLVTNVPPVANPDSYAIAENTTNTLTPLVNDVLETPGGNLTVIAVSSTNGLVSILNGTNVTFTPTNNFLGTTTLPYTITDNVGGTNSSYMTVLVTNVPPVANPDAYSMAENTTNTFAPLVNDVLKTPGGTLQIIGVSPTNGTAMILNLTNVIFTPTSNFVGTATIGYTITDLVGGTSSSVITVAVTNIAPLAFGQSLATTENAALPITLTGSDPASHPLTFVIVSGPAGGTLTGLNTNTGALTYTPTNNFTGTDTFTFHVNNGFNSSSNATVTIAVTPVADLLVAQSGPAGGIAGNSLVFTVAITNLGPASTTNIVVTNQIDAGFTFASASAAGTTNGDHQVIWTVPVLPANGTTNLTVTLFAIEGGTFTNIASGLASTPDLNLTNNNGSLTNAQVVTTISALADVAVFKTGTTSVLAGGTVNYAITATNFGPSTASNMVVRDTLPMGVTVQSASGTYSMSNAVIIWSAAILPGGTATNFTVTLTAPDSGTLTNIASSTSDTADPNPGNNDGSSPGSVVITPVTPVADLAITKSAAASVLATSNLVYTISVTNFGPSTATSVTVTDSVPTGAGFINASSGSVHTSNLVTWSLGDLASGTVSNLTLTVAAPTSGTLTNVANVGSPIGDPNLTNNTTPPVVTTVTPVADLAIGKNGPAGATFNTNFNYTISVTNFGPSAASGILVTDMLPAGLEFASAVPATTTNASGQVVWNLGNLAANTTTNLTLSVLSTARGAITNLAAVGGPTLDPSLTNNLSQLVVTLVTNILPLANPDNYAISENSGTNTFSPLLNDVVRNPGGTLQLVSVNTTNGTAAINGTNVLFVPGTNYFGPLTITYSITDNEGGTNSSYITVLVTNLAPLANPDTYTVGENSGTSTLSPLVNDVVRTPGGILNLLSVTPTNGTANISGTNVLFTPTLNFFGVATIGYIVTDGIGGTNASVITVNVTNVPPVANGQSVNTAENMPVQITLTGSDPNSLPLTFAIVGSPTNGTLGTLNPNTGVVTYTPSTNSSSGDSFTFRVNNGQTNSAPATVSITVAPVADVVVVESGPATGFAGSNLVFTVSVTNRGPATATSLAVSNLLAPGFTFVSASGSGANAGQLVVWNFATLLPNAVTNFTVTAFATEGGTFTNIASGAAAQLDSNPTNNNGSLGNAKSVTVLAPVVDLVVYKVGGTNVFAGATVNYTIIASNAGPSTATSMVIQDTLPAGGTFQSATGSYTASNGVVTWSGLTLAPGAVTTFNITLLASPTVTSFVNIASGTTPAYDPNLTNNNGSLSASRVNTKVTPSADMIATITGPANAILGSNIVFTLYLTNVGPSTASNIVAYDVLPPDLLFVSASAGGTNSNGTNASGTITWPPIAALGAGGSTDFVFMARALIAGVYTNTVSSTSVTYDPNPTNNTGVLPTAQSQTQVTQPEFSLMSGAPVFNPQTGLYEEQVTVTNTGTGTVPGIQLYTGGLRTGVSLYNASGTNGGVPYVQYGFPLDPTNTVHFVLEFYDPSRLAFTNTLYVEAYTPTNITMVNGSNSVPVNAVFTDTRTQPARVVIEWASVPGTTYLVIYASSVNATNWSVATPSITATANITQWYDDGPPETSSAPLTVNTRFYRIIKY